MPIYTFRNINTNEIFDLMMSISDLDLYKAANPDHERYFDGAPSIVSGVSITNKTSDGFKEVLSKVAEAHPDSYVGQTHGRKSIKQVQTARAIQKWRSSTTN